MRRTGLLGKNTNRRAGLRFERLETREMLAFVPELVRDINQADEQGSEPRGYVAFAGKTYFTAESVDEGRELWVTDGTSIGTKLFKDVVPGRGGLTTEAFVPGTTQFFFSHNDGVHGEELWVSDGSSAGTRMVKDIVDGTLGNVDLLAVFGDEAFISVNRNGLGWELWKSDGTAEGTTQVVHYRSNAREPAFRIFSDDTLFFVTSDQLWATGGTLESTRMLRNFAPHPQSYLTAFVASDGTLYFSPFDGNGYELWKSDGTAAGTQLVRDLQSHGGANEFAERNGIVYFAASAPDSRSWAEADVELWRTNGTDAGTWRVVDLTPGTKSSFPKALKAFNGALYFFANDGTHGEELFRSDGTATGTVRLTDTYEVSPGLSLSPSGNLLYFTAKTTSALISDLWVTDGTALGTREVDFSSAAFTPVFPSWIVVRNGALHFSATYFENGIPRGREPWILDANGARLLKDIYTGTESSNISQLTDVAGTLAFVDGQDDWSLWRSNGTRTGTTVVASSQGAGQESTPPANLSESGGTLFFDSFIGQESARFLWRSDLSTVGTYPIAQIGVPGSYTGWSPYPADINGTLYFVGQESLDSRELWRSNGTPATTFPVVSLAHGLVGTQITAAGSNLYYTARSGNFNRLHVSDGTAQGTRLVDGENLGESGGRVAAIGNRLYFRACHFDLGCGLWTTDGSPSGTRLVKDIVSGMERATIRDLAVVGNTLYAWVVADEGWQLWRSDGTTAGTALVYHSTVAEDYFGDWPVVFNARVYFTIKNSHTGWALWASDGTTAGTQVVFRQPSSVNQAPNGFTVAGNTMFFYSYDSNQGWQLWQTDGTPRRTRIVMDIEPKAGWFPFPNVSRMASVNGTLFFTADDGRHGMELWKLTYTPPAAGDLNDDGRVDREDLSMLAENFGTPSGAAYDRGDLDRNGRIGLGDLIQLRNLIAPQTAPAAIVAQASEVSVAATNRPRSDAARRKENKRVVTRSAPDDLPSLSAPAADEVFAGQNRRTSIRRVLNATDRALAIRS
jgi:ELWxxDGT repeat protein